MVDIDPMDDFRGSADYKREMARELSEVEQRLVELLRRQPESRHYVLGITANAVEVVPDKQGRILVPQRLLQGVGVTESALLVGVIDRIEAQ